MAKQVHKYDPVSGGYISSYKNIAEAAREHSVDESNIRRVANGERNVAASFIWSYHKRANIADTDVVDEFLTKYNIPPEEVTRTRVNEIKNGVRISVETKRTPELNEEDLTKMNFIGKSKLLQRKTDELRIVKKEFRESARVENTLTALNEALINLLRLDTFKPITYNHPEKEGPVLVVQLTDTHFNELVTLPDNLYGFEMGAKRLQKYADKIRRIADVYKVKGIVLALTGDIINSDRRLDEMMNQATNRMKAAVISSQILYHFIQDINRAANINVVSVSGNESRVRDEHGMSEYLMSDNYDYLIYNILKILFEEKDGITFVDGDPVEQVINVNNSNILVTHGTTIKEGQAFMQQVFGKYAAKGILLDYAIFGHVHFTNITDIYSRSGSLVGNNVYSDRYLNLVTKASQVIHVIEKDGSIDNIKVSLQYVDGYKGYGIKDDANAYNSVLRDNSKERQTIVQVVI